MVIQYGTGAMGLNPTYLKKNEMFKWNGNPICRYPSQSPSWKEKQNETLTWSGNSLWYQSPNPTKSKTKWNLYMKLVIQDSIRAKLPEPQSHQNQNKMKALNRAIIQ